MGTILVIYKPRDSINVLFLPPRSPFGFFCLLFQIFLLRQFIEVIGNHVNLRKDKDKHRILNRMEEKILRRFEKLDTLEHRFTARVASLVFSSIWYDLLSRWYFGQHAIMCSIQFISLYLLHVGWSFFYRKVSYYHSNISIICIVIYIHDDILVFVIAGNVVATDLNSKYNLSALMCRVSYKSVLFALNPSSGQGNFATLLLSTLIRFINQRDSWARYKVYGAANRIVSET